MFIVNYLGEIIDSLTNAEDYGQPTKEVAEQIDIDNLQNQINQITVTVPYFQQAAQVILFAKTNTNSYPQSMNALRSQDDTFISDGSYTGLSEGDKAQLLIDNVSITLGI